MNLSGKLPAPAAFYEGKRPWYPLDRGLGSPRKGVYDVKRKISCPRWEAKLIPRLPSPQTVATLAEPSRLLITVGNSYIVVGNKYVSGNNSGVCSVSIAYAIGCVVMRSGNTERSALRNV
jgi:hypothetical protein